MSGPKKIAKSRGEGVVIEPTFRLLQVDKVGRTQDRTKADLQRFERGFSRLVGRLNEFVQHVNFRVICGSTKCGIGKSLQDRPCIFYRRLFVAKKGAVAGGGPVLKIGAFQFYLENPDSRTFVSTIEGGPTIASVKLVGSSLGIQNAADGGCDFLGFRFDASCFGFLDRVGVEPVAWYGPVVDEFLEVLWVVADQGLANRFNSIGPIGKGQSWLKSLIEPDAGFVPFGRFVGYDEIGNFAV